MNDKELKEEDIKEIEMMNQFVKTLLDSLVSSLGSNDETQGIRFFFQEFTSVEDFNLHLITNLNMHLNRAFAFSGLFQLLGITEEKLDKALQEVKNSDYKDNAPIVELFRGRKLGFMDLLMCESFYYAHPSVKRFLLNAEMVSRSDKADLAYLYQYVEAARYALETGSAGNRLCRPPFKTEHGRNRHLVMSLDSFLKFEFAFSGMFELLGFTAKDLDNAIQEIVKSNYQNHEPLLKLFRG